MARERARAPLGHLTTKRRERKSMMAKEKKRFANLQQMGLRSLNQKSTCNHEHMQPTKTCNPKTQTQCAKERLKKNSRTFNCPLFHSSHTHEQKVSEVP
jgi:hypothetical protein